MGKFMNAKFDSDCMQTGKRIKKNDHVYYVPGRGAFHRDSDIYMEHRKVNTSPEGDHVQANEEAYFDNFCRKNNI